MERHKIYKGLIYTYISIYKRDNMAKKIISLSVEEEIYNEYRKFCEEKGIILSKQFENFMKEELNKNHKKG